MDSGNLEAALEAYDQARELDPKFAPVEFNRALALERLGLPRAGLQAMREASQVALGGWKDEAARTVAALERTAQSRAAGSERVEAARRALLDGTLPDPQLVKAYPGTFRFQLYTALAFAPDRAAAEKLLPLARQLDGIGEGHRLEEWVTRTAARSNARRSALAPRLRDFTASSPAELRAALLAEAEAAGQEDQALYVLSREFPSRDQRLAQLAARLHDPFWDLRVLASRARVEWQAGRPTEAERLARSVPEGLCRDQTLSGECYNVAYELAQTYAYAGRPADAQRVFEAARAEAAKAPHPIRDRGLLLYAGATNADADRVALARAQFEEADRLSSADCQTRVYSLISVAQAYVRRGDARSTRAVLASMPSCEHTNLGFAAEVQADLAVLGGAADDRARAREWVAKAETAARSPVEQLTVGAVRVMLDAEEGKEGTLARFRELLGRSRVVTGAEDLIARAGRSVGLQLLRESRGKEAIALAAEMLATPAPDGCALAVIADSRRLGFASIDRGGAVSQQVLSRSARSSAREPSPARPTLSGAQRARSHRFPGRAALAPGGPGLEPSGGPVAPGRSAPVRAAAPGARRARPGRPQAAAARRTRRIRAGLGGPGGARCHTVASPGAAGAGGPGGLRGARHRGREGPRWSRAGAQPGPERDVFPLRLRHPGAPAAARAGGAARCVPSGHRVSLPRLHLVAPAGLRAGRGSRGDRLSGRVAGRSGRPVSFGRGPARGGGGGAQRGAEGRAGGVAPTRGALVTGNRAVRLRGTRCNRSG